jgi:hypothetical protein
MIMDRDFYNEVKSNTNLKKAFQDIRRNVNHVSTRPALTELYKRAGDLITLTSEPDWQEKFGTKADVLRKTGQEEFRRTAKKINRRATEIGTEADYDEWWGRKR